MAILLGGVCVPNSAASAMLTVKQLAICPRLDLDGSSVHDPPPIGLVHEDALLRIL